jgi:hypothetical protein
LPTVLEKMVRVELADPPGERTRLVGFIEAVRPLVAVSVRVTVPENPPRLPTVIEEVPEEPTTSLTLDELDVMLKSDGWLTVRLIVSE